MLLSLISNGQWYNRRYGVNDLNQLSQEQIDLALVNANFEFGSGIFLIIAGATGLIGGYLIGNNAPPGDLGAAFTAVSIIGISIPAEIAGWIMLTENSKRLERIKDVMKSREVHLGFINYQNENTFSGSKGSLLPGLSLTIHF